jgi:TrmH family RNA methyltransferase
MHHHSNNFVMISAAQQKYIRSLQQQKYRKAHKAYVAEGEKIVLEYLKSTALVEYIAATPEFLQTHQFWVQRHPEATILSLRDFEFEKISGLKTNITALLVVKQSESERFELVPGQWSLLLDAVQDPGNMGTIIRIADWFGIQQVICLAGCVEVYNPKVVQAAMGSLLRVKISTIDPDLFFPNLQLPVYATVLDGENIRKSKSLQPGIIVMGNESQGISEAVKQYATHHIAIPGSGAAESLNVAVATGIICYALLGNE